MTAHGRILVIGYGNTLRGDDGAGIAAAARIRYRRWPGVEVLLLQQLTPELAEPLATATSVFFIDAGIDPASPSVHIEPVRLHATAGDWTHTSDQSSLLALAERLFGRSPPAWLVTISGRDFSISEHLSPHAIAGVAEAVARMEERLAQQPARV